MGQWKNSLQLQEIKLKHSGVIYTCYSLNGGVVCIKKTEHGKPTKILHMNSLYDILCNFKFDDDEGEKC